MDASPKPTRKAAEPARPGPDQPRGSDAGASIELAAMVARQLERLALQPAGPGLHLVATPIGNLGDITLRALSTLATVDLVCCEDTRHSGQLLAHFGISRPLRPYHEHNAERERPVLLDRLRNGQRIALISDAGTPLVCDPGYKLVRAAVEAGIAVSALPGPSAVLAALGPSGLPTDRVVFAGFLPNRAAQREERIHELAAIKATLVLFEAPQRLKESLAALAAVMGQRPAVVARELTKRHEQFCRGTLDELAQLAQDWIGEIVIVVAPPVEAEVADADIVAALAALAPTHSLRDAAREVAAALGVGRRRVYDLALDQWSDK